MEDILFHVKSLIVAITIIFTVLLVVLYVLVLHIKDICKSISDLYNKQDNLLECYYQFYNKTSKQFDHIQDRLLVLTSKHTQQIRNLEEQVKHAKQRANIAESKLKKINQERRSQ